MTKRYKIIISVCIAVVFCNLIAKLTFLDGQAQKILLLQKDISAIRRALVIQPEKTANPVEEMKFNIDKIFQKIPDEFSFTQLAAKLRILIDENDLVVDNTLVFRPVKTENLRLVSYYTKFSVKGDYGKIKGFISDLQNVPGLLYLDSVKIVRLEENETQLMLSLGVSIFFKKRAA